MPVLWFGGVDMEWEAPEVNLISEDDTALGVACISGSGDQGGCDAGAGGPPFG